VILTRNASSNKMFSGLRSLRERQFVRTLKQRCNLPMDHPHAVHPPDRIDNLRRVVPRAFGRKGPEPLDPRKEFAIRNEVEDKVYQEAESVHPFKQSTQLMQRGAACWETR
jgi:hypothetical protein